MREEYSQEYDIDVQFGIHLYNYMNNLSGFTMRVADDDFWRYLSVKGAHIVAMRWGKTMMHIIGNILRIWLRVIWWYVHLSWQGNTKTHSIT